MNQFKDIESRLKKNKKALSVAKDFDYILNNIWSIYSYEKGKSRWNAICNDIDEPFSQQIMIELSHVFLGHGKEQALIATKSEMVRYLEYLLNK